MSKCALFWSLGLHAIIIGAATAVTLHEGAPAGNSGSAVTINPGFLLTTEPANNSQPDPVAAADLKMTPPVGEHVEEPAIAPSVEAISAPPVVTTKAVPALIPSAPPRSAQRHSTGTRDHEVGAAGQNGSGSASNYTPPRYRHRSAPIYPASARFQHAQGVVILAVVVDALGRPARVMVRKSSGSSALDSAAVTAVQHWDFEPARRGGVAIEALIEIPVRFELTH